MDTQQTERQYKLYLNAAAALPLSALHWKCTWQHSTTRQVHTALANFRTVYDAGGGGGGMSAACACCGGGGGGAPTPCCCGGGGRWC